MTNIAYRKGIYTAYQGELIGECLYRELAKRSTDPIQKAKLDAVADVECLTHSTLRPIADRLNIALSEAEWRSIVERRANELAPLAWPDFIRRAMRDWPPYIVSFQALQPLAPHRDATSIQFLVDHEVALVDFARAETAAIGSGSSLLVLEEFLRKAREPLNRRLR